MFLLYISHLNVNLSILLKWDNFFGIMTLVLYFHTFQTIIKEPLS